MDQCMRAVIIICLINKSGALNIARGKHANQSSTSGDYTPNNAVDGSLSNNFDDGSCIHTLSNEETAWWQVDLEGIYTITTITVSYRKDYASRLAGFSIYVSNLTDWSTGEMCYKDISEQLLNVNEILYFFCTRFLLGRYVTFYNERLRNSTYPEFYDIKNGAILELCEIEIQDPAPCLHCHNKSISEFCFHESSKFKCKYGCDPGFFGESCTRNCSTSCGGNRSCEVKTGVCRKCNDTFYRNGIGCVSCSPSCGGKGYCDIDTGRCTVCDQGMYVSGISCIPCPVNCKGVGKACFTTNGTCIKGCNDYFFGLKCESKCQFNCRNCVNESHCNECKIGYSGHICNDECNTCLDRSCDIEGRCILGCKNGYYGKGCKLNCTDTCLNNQCEKNSGFCSKGCVPRKHGQYCNMTCPDNCGGEKECAQMSGICTVCDIGKFDNLCTSNCSSQCGGSGSCDIRTGYCDSCNDGWMGNACNVEILIQRRTDNGIAATVGGGIFAIVVIIVIAIGVIVVLLKRRTQIERRRTGQKLEESSQAVNDEMYMNVNGQRQIGSSLPSVHFDESSNGSVKYQVARGETQKNSHSSQKEIAEGIYYNCLTNAANDVSINEFKHYTKTKIADGSLLKEYQTLPSGSKYSTIQAQKPEHKAKNRFKTTFPYDKTRVILNRDDTDTSDYINANFVHGKDMQNTYIASQGPLHNTVDDFWHMIWQCKVGKIVMLTGLVEGKKNKCHKYWPDINEHLQYGDIAVRTLDERCYFYYTLREMKVEHKKIKESRCILHFHFTAWPDHDVTNPILLVQFHRRVENKMSDQNGPLLVHCSAGIGRTGTYIGLDHLAYEAKQTKRINVENCVRQMRECRITMVQKPLQYVLLHEAILEEIQLPRTSILMSDFTAEWDQMMEGNEPVEKHRLTLEFETLHEMKKRHGADDYKAANLPENINKNRHREKFQALDECRPLLKNIRGRTDYVNAVTVPSVTSVSGFIVTQRPLPETVEDFWRLIQDYQVTTIVHFESDTEDRNVFYPHEKCKLEMGLFVVNSLKETAYDCGLDERELSIMNEDCDDGRVLKLFTIHVQKENSPTGIQVLKTIDLVSNWKQGQKNGPCVVVSIDGTKFCDIFCAVWNIIESMHHDNVIDIFQTVRFLQMKRPEFFTDYHKYRFCYEIINQHLTSENVYFN